MKKSTIVWLALSFIMMAIMMGQIYKAGLTRPPLKYAKIPDSTKEFIKRLKSDHGGVTLGGFGPFNWDNDSDLGVSDEWSKEEDEDFIVYYHKDNKARWQGRAQEVLKLARGATTSLAALMGQYFYASDMNGRKLAFYLPASDSEYAQVCNELYGRPYDSSRSLGVTFTQIGPLGCLTRGISLRPRIFEASSRLNSFEVVVPHEMHHYVFLSSLDYSKVIRHYNWMTEGMAEFYCDRYVDSELGLLQIKEIENNYYLNGDFANGAEYWAGESFFRFMQKTFGDQFVRNFIQSSYVNSTAKLLTDSLLLQNMSAAVRTTGNISPEAQAIVQAIETIRKADPNNNVRDFSAFMHDAWVMSLRGKPFADIEAGNMEAESEGVKQQEE